MKTQAIQGTPTVIKKILQLSKQTKYIDLKPIKNYTQYMKEYGLKY